jgi:hypothetical protein
MRTSFLAPSGGGIRRLLLLLAIVLPARSISAQESPPSGEPPSAEPPGESGEPGAEPQLACDGAFDLDLGGAAQRSGEEGATFVESWRPSLEAATACVRAAGAERTCVEVQGQYDDHTFDTAIARSMGGQRAAQIHRARGRSEAVVTELAEMGVPYDRIRHRPPPAQPTYRGVRVQLLRDCLPPPAEAEMPEWASTPEVLAENLTETGLVAGPTPAAEPRPRPVVGPFSIDGALALGFSMSGADDAYSLGLRTAFGWGEERLYARVLFELGTADDLEQRAHVGWGVSGGFRPVRWLRLGGVFTQRFGTYEAFDPWFEWSWHLGVEAEQRVAELDRVSVWIGESLSPIGARYQRATIANGQPFDSADRSDYAMQAQLVITVRGHIAAGAGLAGTHDRARD